MQRIEVRVKGQVDRDWSDWIGGLTVTYSGGETVLSGTVRDQSALHGLLCRLADLGLHLLSVDATGRVPEERKEDPYM